MAEKPSPSKMKTRPEKLVKVSGSDDDAYSSRTSDLYEQFAQMEISFPDVCAPNKQLVNALKVLQHEKAKLEVRFFKECHELECKYVALNKENNKKRAQIIAGAYEPKDEECILPLPELVTQDESEEEVPDHELTKGLPEFWLKSMLNVELLASMIYYHDMPVLKYLTDIELDLFDSEHPGFRLDFHFEPNDYFENSVLTKTYEMSVDITERNVYSFEGLEIVRCFGCNIRWKEGRCYTCFRKHSGQCNTFRSTFFEFFKPPHMELKQLVSDLDEISADKLSADFEVGHFLKDRFIPNAALYYTGEADDLDDEDIADEQVETEEITGNWPVQEEEEVEEN